jgi:hypothetical protein
MVWHTMPCQPKKNYGANMRGSARTTAAVRRAIEHGQASLNQLAQRSVVNPKTVAKRKQHSLVHDARWMGPTRRSTVLTPEQEGIGVAFRRHTLPALGVCLNALQSSLRTETDVTHSTAGERLGACRFEKPVECCLPARIQCWRGAFDRRFFSLIFFTSEFGVEIFSVAAAGILAEH